MRILVSALIVACLPALAAAAVLQDVKVVNDRAPDCSSLKAIVDSVTRNCKTDDERAIAIYNFCRYAYYHHAYPTEDGGIGAVKMLNVYGWGLCGGQHSVLAALYEAAGYKWRFRGWSNPGHTTIEVFYGGRWHYLDTFLKFYCWMPDPARPGQRTIAGQDDIKANPALVNDGFVFDSVRGVCYHKDNAFDYVGGKINAAAPAFMVCGDDLPGLLSGIRSSNLAGSPRGWASVNFDEPRYSTAVNLSAGYCLTLDWAAMPDAWYFRGSRNSPRHTCGGKDVRNSADIGPLLEPYGFGKAPRTWSNGTLVFRPDLGNGAFLDGLREAKNVEVGGGEIRPKEAGAPGVLTIAMASPYVVAKAMAKVEGEVKGEVSVDDGKSWRPLDAAKLSETVAGTYAYLVRLTLSGPVKSIELTSIVQHNQQALPYLAPGENVITISAGNAEALGGNRLAVTYAYCPGSRSATADEIYDEGGQIGGAHATWSTTPVVVRKVFDKLPATIRIPVATPKGKQPVYPRMLFVRREVLAPGQAPAAAPAEPSDPAVGADEALATLPEPWTLGTTPPPPAAQGPVKSITLTPTKVMYASNAGEVSEHHPIRWTKDNKEAWVFLCAFDTAGLPDAKRLVSAKLNVWVYDAHEKAPSQAAAVLLNGPFTPGKAFDLTQLGQSVGTAIIARSEGGAPFDPAKQYEIDVTAAVRAWIKAGKCDGLALRVVPNRGVDDGWTVRFTPRRQEPVELVVTAR